ncbi:hypothetical protein BDR26DRAFT_930758 [Obelidium mucronatum]|nr:hypothetical protein BDR26DRAFT_930758 [Obelidium mucronatum]
MPVSLLSLPQELLDVIVSYLQARDLVSFCQAVPALRRTVTVLCNVAKLFGHIGRHLHMVWPNASIWTLPAILTDNDVANISAFGSLMSRYDKAVSFNVNPTLASNQNLIHVAKLLGSTISFDFHRVEVEDICRLAQELKYKTIEKFSWERDYDDPFTVEELSKIKTALVEFNPRCITVWAGVKAILETLPKCNRLQCLNVDFVSCGWFDLEYDQDESLFNFLEKCLALRELTFTFPFHDALMAVFQVLSRTSIKKFTIAYMGQNEDDGHYGTTKEQMDSLLRNVGFLLKGIQGVNRVYVKEQECKQ